MRYFCIGFQKGRSGPEKLGGVLQAFASSSSSSSSSSSKSSRSSVTASSQQLLTVLNKVEIRRENDIFVGFQKGRSGPEKRRFWHRFVL